MRRGLTLTETVLAISLLSIVGMALLGVFLRSTLLLGYTKSSSQAGELAEGLLEVARSQPFATYAPDRSVPLSPVTLSGGEFRAVLKAQTIPGENALYVKQLTVQVTWIDKTRAHSVERSVYVANLPR